MDKDKIHWMTGKTRIKSGLMFRLLDDNPSETEIIHPMFL